MAVHRPHMKQKKKIQSAHADDYYNVLNDSKERYGFMTGSTLELLHLYIVTWH